MSRFALALALTALPAPADALAAVRSPNWRDALRHSGLTGKEAAAIRATPATSGTAPSAGAVNPVATTARINNLLLRYHTNAARFTHYHPNAAPLVKEEARLLAGNCDPLSSVNGLVPTTSVWNYLRWRRSLDPVRFDRHHRSIGPLLALDQLVRTTIANCPQQQVLIPPNTPPPTTPVGVSSGGSGGPPSVPEPSGLALLAVGLMGFGLARRRLAPRS